MKERPPKRLALLIFLLLAWVIAPPLLYWLSHYASGGLALLLTVPIYAQGVYPGSIFGSPLYAMGNAGPYPVGVAGWTVTVIFWLIISFSLWAGIRWLRFVTNS